MAYNKNLSNELKKDKGYQEYLNSNWCTLNTAKGKITLNKVAFTACCAAGILLIPTNAIMTGTLTIGKLVGPAVFGLGAWKLHRMKKKTIEQEDEKVNDEVEKRERTKTR